VPRTAIELPKALRNADGPPAVVAPSADSVAAVPRSAQQCGYAAASEVSLSTASASNVHHVATRIGPAPIPASLQRQP